MARGRPSQLKISESEFRDLLLEKIVDDKGMKVSLRTVFSYEDFMIKTGYYNLKEFKRTGTYRMISPGTIAYIMNKKLNLYSQEVYYYHKFITKKISSNTSYTQFMYKKNNPIKIGVYNAMRINNNLNEVPKDKLVWVLNSISKSIKGYPELDVCFANEFMSYETFENYSERLRIFYNNDVEFIKLFRERLRAFRQTYVDRKSDKL